MGAHRVRERVGGQVWNTYFKFAVERNPWDRAVSLYYWIYRNGPLPDFGQFVASGELLRLKRRGRDLYTIDGQVVVDRILRYEDLANELELVRIEVGIESRLELPRAKSSFRGERRSYRDYYGDAERQRVADLFAEEIALFGYTF
jgi:hypothetical protein